MKQSKGLQSFLQPRERPIAPGIELSAVDEFRAQLAVRGWTYPTALMASDNSMVRDKLLSAISPEVETASQAKPGQWFLSNSVRQRTLSQVPRKKLLGLVTSKTDVDREDPIRQAFEIWARQDIPELEALETGVLSALQQVHSWTGKAWDESLKVTQIETQLAARQLNTDLERLTRYPLVGKGHREARENLLEFVSRPQKDKISAVYIFGVGGTGKSTVLAGLHRQFVAVGMPGTIARIDFDEPKIDPSRMATLNLELFKQLCRDVDGLADRRSYIVEELRGLVDVQLSQEIAEYNSSTDTIERIKRGTRMAAESHEILSSSDESSILYGTLWPDVIGGPLVIILDTAELVLAQSDSQAAGIVEWLNFLETEGKAKDIRLVIAGRDPPSSAGSDRAGPALRDLLDRLRDKGVVFEPNIHLSNLEIKESEVLLRNVGLEEPGIIAAAARAVPGNPLLLRITADALRKGGGKLRQEVLDAHRQGQIDRESARNYLTLRIVAHVADPVARPFVLGAMISPVVTADLLQHAIIPSVERDRAGIDPNGQLINSDKRLAERVFRALQSTRWLCRISLDDQTLIFERDIREFVLKLLRQVHPDGILERDIRQSSVIYHLRKRGDLHRAMSLYHLALLGSDYTKPRDRDQVRPWLRDVQSELPSDLQRWLEPPELVDEESMPPKAAAIGTKRLSDQDWRLYLEGAGRRDGEGMSLVKKDHAAEALDHYFSRPTRSDGMPPSFVIRALSDLGDWYDGHIDVEAMIEEHEKEWRSKKRLSPNDLSEIYWLTRFAMLRDETWLSERHVDLLEDVSRIARGPGLTQLPSLIAVAEAALERPIMDERMRQAALKSGNEVRILLGDLSRAKLRPSEVALQQVAVVQRDWSYRIDKLLLGTETYQADKFAMLQNRLDDFHGKPLAEVNQFLERSKSLMRIDFRQLDSRSNTLLFRSFTPEFHRPLREALIEESHDPEMQIELFGIVIARMSIVPEEIELEKLKARMTQNPRAWTSALVGFADQARLLPLVARSLTELTSNKKSKYISKSFAAWDRCLCRGGNSEWN